VGSNIVDISVRWQDPYPDIANAPRKSILAPIFCRLAHVPPETSFGYFPPHSLTPHFTLVKLARWADGVEQDAQLRHDTYGVIKALSTVAFFSLVATEALEVNL